LIVLVAFLALTAIGGGIGLLTGSIAPGLELLAGSPFASYAVPGLALVVLVGGSALVATVGLIRRYPRAIQLAGLSGAMIVGFEVVEVLIIGSDPGVARNLQLFYFTLGLAILVVAGVLSVTSRRADSGE
jgi:peptidoglycan/LPS O-acetylase OafA/YrhL